MDNFKRRGVLNNPDRTCINCRHWLSLLRMEGTSYEKVCRLKNAPTGPADTCDGFSPKSTFDDIENPDRFIDRPDILR